MYLIMVILFLKWQDGRNSITCHQFLHPLFTNQCLDTKVLANTRKKLDIKFIQITNLSLSTKYSFTVGSKNKVSREKQIIPN